MSEVCLVAILSNCCPSRINAWSRLVTKVSGYISVINARYQINAWGVGVAPCTIPYDENSVLNLCISRLSLQG